MKDYTVTCTQTCPACEGRGFFDSEIWQAMQRDTKKFHGAPPPSGWYDAWAREHGYANADDMGPDEEECVECGGVGTVVRQVPLVEALRDLGLEVRPSAENSDDDSGPRP